MIDLCALLSAVSECKNALIVGHSHPDGDCVGSAVALSCLIESLGNRASIIFPEPSPKRLEFMLGEKKELPSLPSDLESYDIICVDTASHSQHGDMKESLFGKAALRIDHHDVSVPYAKQEFVNPLAAATGEIIFELYEYAISEGKAEKICDTARDALYGAISSDTGCFKYSNATPKTHMLAAKLIEYGAPSAEINRLLFDTKDENLLRAEGIALGHLRTFANGKIGGIAIEESDYADGLCISDFETAIDFARSVRGVKCAAVAKATAVEGVFRVSLRANNDTDVSAIAALFGGGGHIRAAGCTVAADTAKEALEKVIMEIEKVLI